MCGKMAAGKSTLAKRLAEERDAALFIEDELLSALFPTEIADLNGYILYSGRLKAALTTPICNLLARGVPVVLDFPGNTKQQREWFRRLIAASGAPHELHYVDVADETCKQQLRKRNATRETDAALQTEETFDLLLPYFTAPEADEGFTVIHHRRP